MSCNAHLTYEIGDGGPWSSCRHADGYFYCILGAPHDGKHMAPVVFEASSDKEPFSYEHTVTVQWD